METLNLNEKHGKIPKIKKKKFQNEEKKPEEGTKSEWGVGLIELYPEKGRYSGV